MVKEDVESLDVREEDAEVRVRWRQRIESLKEKAERKRRRQGCMTTLRKFFVFES